MSFANPYAPDISPELEHSNARASTKVFTKALKAEPRQRSTERPPGPCFPALDFRPPRRPSQVAGRKARDARRGFAEELRERQTFACFAAEPVTETCRWPEGDGPFVFCGRAVSARSFCNQHHSQAYR